MPSNPFERSRKDLWLLRFVALVISVLLWLTVMGGKSVELTKKINLEFSTPKNLAVANQPPREISIRVSGASAFIRELQERSMSLAIDLSQAHVGENEVILREEMLDLPLGIRVLNINPNTLKIVMDRVSSKRVPIRAIFSSRIPEELKPRSVSFRPSTIEIRGPTSRIQNIDAIPTEPISLQIQSQKQEIDVGLATSEFPGINFDDTKTVHVSVDLEGNLVKKWFKQIPISIMFNTGSNTKKRIEAGQLGIRMKPETVSFLVEGSDKNMAALKESDFEVWLEIPQLKPGVYKSRLVWKLSPDIHVLKRSTDTVDVVIPSL